MAAELPDVAKDAEEDLLGQVGGLLGVSGEAQGQVEDHLVEPVVDLLESLDVADPMTLDQLQVQVVYGGVRDSRGFHRPSRLSSIQPTNTETHDDTKRFPRRLLPIERPGPCLLRGRGMGVAGARRATGSHAIGGTAPEGLAIDVRLLV